METLKKSKNNVVCVRCLFSNKKQWFFDDSVDFCLLLFLISITQFIDGAIIIIIITSSPSASLSYVDDNDDIQILFCSLSLFLLLSFIRVSGHQQNNV